MTLRDAMLASRNDGLVYGRRAPGTGPVVMWISPDWLHTLRTEDLVSDDWEALPSSFVAGRGQAAAKPPAPAARDA